MPLTPLPLSSAPPAPVSKRIAALGLDQLAPGESAVVVDVLGDGPIERRLLDLGLLPGTKVLALRRAPLGDPIEYELRGYRLCLRRSEARRVRVARTEEGPTATTPDATLR
jgi:ferrous iron transport protein A